jgi:hypothetical protein
MKTKGTAGPYLHPDQTPQELAENARRMAARRWQGTTPEERKAALREVGKQRVYAPDPTKPRCPCGAMTLARAQARGRGQGHRPGCPFHRPRAK